MVVVPALTAVTTPDELTVAMVFEFELHMTDLLVAFDGRTVAVNVLVLPG